PMSSDDTATLAISGASQNLIVGLLSGPNQGLSLNGSTLKSFSLPADSYPISILIRDRAKCAAAGGASCEIALDSYGRYTAAVQTNSAYDAKFDFTLQVEGNGTGNWGGQQPWNPPGFQNNPNPSFWGKLTDNFQYGVGWIWQWILGLGQN